MFATCIIVISAVSGHADTVLLKGSSKGSTEGYFGSAISANQDKVVFDIECSGKKVELFWSKGLTDLTFNKTCKPQGALGAGGFDLDCSKVFMIIDNALEAEVFTSKFTYSAGVVTLDEGRYNVDQKTFIDAKGKVTKLSVPKETKDPFAVYIIHMRNAWGKCSKNKL